jgi:spore coat protein U-like protein
MGFSSAHRPSLAITALACLAMAASPKLADSTTATTTFLVTANVATVCELSATAMAFGTYAPTTASTATSVITVTCNLPYNIGLDPGKATGATVTTRAMANTTTPTAPVLNYSLYSDSARTKNWGQTIGTDTVVGTASATATDFTVYGTVPAAQNSVQAGAYQDTITATLTF